MKRSKNIPFQVQRVKQYQETRVESANFTAGFVHRLLPGTGYRISTFYIVLFTNSLNFSSSRGSLEYVERGKAERRVENTERPNVLYFRMSQRRKTQSKMGINAERTGWDRMQEDRV